MNYYIRFIDKDGYEDFYYPAKGNNEAEALQYAKNHVSEFNLCKNWEVEIYEEDK